MDIRVGFVLGAPVVNSIRAMHDTNRTVGNFALQRKIFEQNCRAVTLESTCWMGSPFFIAI